MVVTKVGGSQGWRKLEGNPREDRKAEEELSSFPLFIFLTAQDFTVNSYTVE